MSESSLRQRTTKALKRLDAVAIENSLASGTPDVEFIGGWMELKFLPKWPVRDETPVRIEHFTTNQRAWLIRRHLRGERTWLLLQVSKDYLLFRGEDAARNIGKLTRRELVALAVTKWSGNKLDAYRLYKAVASNQEKDTDNAGQHGSGDCIPEEISSRPPLGSNGNRPRQTGNPDADL